MPHIWLSACAVALSLSALSMVGLILIALGTGGIKPCVAAFGGDQFLEHQVRYLSCTAGKLKKNALFIYSFIYLCSSPNHGLRR